MRCSAPCACARRRVRPQPAVRAWASGGVGGGACMTAERAHARRRGRPTSTRSACRRARRPTASSASRSRTATSGRPSRGPSRAQHGCSSAPLRSMPEQIRARHRAASCTGLQDSLVHTGCHLSVVGCAPAQRALTDACSPQGARRAGLQDDSGARQGVVAVFVRPRMQSALHIPARCLQRLVRKECVHCRLVACVQYTPAC